MKFSMKAAILACFLVVSFTTSTFGSSDQRRKRFAGHNLKAQPVVVAVDGTSPESIELAIKTIWELLRYHASYVPLFSIYRGLDVALQFGYRLVWDPNYADWISSGVDLNSIFVLVQGDMSPGDYERIKSLSEYRIHFITSKDLEHDLGLGLLFLCNLNFKENILSQWAQIFLKVAPTQDTLKRLLGEVDKAGLTYRTPAFVIWLSKFYNDEKETLSYLASKYHLDVGLKAAALSEEEKSDLYYFSLEDKPVFLKPIYPDILLQFAKWQIKKAVLAGKKHITLVIHGRFSSDSVFDLENKTGGSPYTCLDYLGQSGGIKFVQGPLIRNADNEKVFFIEGEEDEEIILTVNVIVGNFRPMEQLQFLSIAKESLVENQAWKGKSSDSHLLFTVQSDSPFMSFSSPEINQNEAEVFRKLERLFSDTKE